MRTRASNDRYETFWPGFGLSGYFPAKLRHLNNGLCVENILVLSPNYIGLVFVSHYLRGPYFWCDIEACEMHLSDLRKQALYFFGEKRLRLRPRIICCRTTGLLLVNEIYRFSFLNILPKLFLYLSTHKKGNPKLVYICNTVLVIWMLRFSVTQRKRKKNPWAL